VYHGLLQIQGVRPGMTTVEPQETDVVKSIELPSGRYIVVLIVVVGSFIILAIAVAQDFNFGAGVFLSVVVGFQAFIAYHVFCEPNRASITTKGTIRFHSPISRVEYDIKTIISLRIVEDSEGDSVRLDFTDGKSLELMCVRQFHELAAAIREVDPTVTIL